MVYTKAKLNDQLCAFKAIITDVSRTFLLYACMFGYSAAQVHYVVKHLVAKSKTILKPNTFYPGKPFFLLASFDIQMGCVFKIDEKAHTHICAIITQSESYQKRVRAHSLNLKVCVCVFRNIQNCEHGILAVEQKQN